MELLRFITAGNVDDGKSTLIGRLLLDSGSVLEDQLAAVERASTRRGDQETNLALLTDGLRAEREQGITIDVAYRYFSSKVRKFIIADCPGHIQYTRNMVTGASNANLAVVLVDARKGMTEQTKRHCFVASLMQIPHLVVCINKMDLVDYSQETFENIRQEFRDFSRKLEIHDIAFIPMSALAGDCVVRGTDKMPWYTGRPLLKHLEEVHIASDVNLIDFRFPVQLVINPTQGPTSDYRGYAGQVASGSIAVGHEIVALPSGFTSRIKSIEIGGQEVREAPALSSAVLRLETEIDLSRGDMIVRPQNRPQENQDLEAILCWLDPSPLSVKKRYILRHTTSEAVVVIKEISYKFDISTLSRVKENLEVGLNDFARVHLRVSKPLFHDSYKNNRTTGAFILIDETSGATLAGGLIV